MAECTSRKFLGLLVISVMAAGALVVVTPLAIRRFLPTRIAYYQISTTGGNGDPQGEPFPFLWARLNHTFITSENKVDSYLQALATMEPDPSPSNVTIQILFEPWDNNPNYDYLVPTVTGGNLTWSGEMHINDTVTVHTVFGFPSDGRYFIGGSALSVSPWALMGGGATGYYVQVQWGQIVKIEGSSMRETVERCIAYC